MGQRTQGPPSTEPAPQVHHRPQDPYALSLFSTALGWFGLWGRSGRVSGLTIGHTSAGQVREFVRTQLGLDASAAPVTESDWFPEMRRRLIKYAEGFQVTFADCPLDLPRLTVFQRRVIEETRKIPFGETLSYGELADQAGFPRAARAVGSVMSSNRIPIVIPCHRVVASGGRMGGFSAPRGVSLKVEMLAMEANALYKDSGGPSHFENARRKSKKSEKRKALTIS